MGLTEKYGLKRTPLEEWEDEILADGEENNNLHEKEELFNKNLPERAGEVFNNRGTDTEEIEAKLRNDERKLEWEDPYVERINKEKASKGGKTGDSIPGGKKSSRKGVYKKLLED